MSLFTGAGGGLLASFLLGWRTLVAVESSEYCQKVLRARQKDGILEKFPIYGDIKEFNGSKWQGYIDVVSGGFPCQAYSSAARGRNVAEDLWPEMLRVIQEVRAPWVFAENVLADAVGKAAVELQGLGYSTAFAQIGSTAVGAPHKRNRWWLVGYADGKGESVGSQHEEVARVQSLAERVWGDEARGGVRASHGMADRMDRVRAIGNGQVPAVAVLAWRILSSALD